jgi:hypothetical protein
VAARDYAAAIFIYKISIVYECQGGDQLNQFVNPIRILHQGQDYL